MADSLYVYYRVHASRRALALSAVEAAFNKVHARFGVQGRLMQRADDSGTWMEIYENVSDVPAFCRLLNEAALQSAFQSVLADNEARHSNTSSA